jgi:16S rRNA (guanine527-N7)-methyltransferase
MQPARIAELLDPFLGQPDARRLTPDALNDISTYINLLQRWNARINLTAIRNEEEIVTRHFGESLFAARHLFPLCFPVPSVVKDFDVANVEPRTAKDVTKVADVGSGPGFPGVPIKLWVLQISLTLIEPNHKKATFLRELARTLTLTDVDVRNARAETLKGISFDVVTLRAVERFQSILPTAADLVTPGGRLALLIGQSQLTQAQSLLPTLDWYPPIPIPHSEARALVVARRHGRQEESRK